MLYHTLHPSIFYTHNIWQVTLHTMLYESIMHHTLHFPHTQHMAGDAAHHALSHTAPLHLLYTQHMAGDASRDVIDHATIGLGVGTFLLMVNDDHTSILHGYGDSLRGFKDFGVTSLTFCGHVTSSVT